MFRLLILEYRPAAIATFSGWHIIIAVTIAVLERSKTINDSLIVVVFEVAVVVFNNIHKGSRGRHTQKHLQKNWMQQNLAKAPIHRKVVPKHHHFLVSVTLITTNHKLVAVAQQTDPAMTLFCRGGDPRLLLTLLTMQGDAECIIFLIFC